MLPNFRIALPATLALSIFASACSTPRPAPQFPPNAPQGQDTREIGLIARPIALLFVSMDRDGDSVTTAEEFTDGMDKEWDSQFRNTDTHLTPFEYEEWAKKKLGHSKAMPSRISFDTDLDGRITKMEFADRLRKEFVSADNNGDGRISRTELISSMPRQQNRGGMGSGPGQNGPSGGSGPGGGQPPRR